MIRLLFQMPVLQLQLDPESCPCCGRHQPSASIQAPGASLLLLRRAALRGLGRCVARDAADHLVQVAVVELGEVGAGLVQGSVDLGLLQLVDLWGAEQECREYWG